MKLEKDMYIRWDEGNFPTCIRKLTEHNIVMIATYNQQENIKKFSKDILDVVDYKDVVKYKQNNPNAILKVEIDDAETLSWFRENVQSGYFEILSVQTEEQYDKHSFKV